MNLMEFTKYKVKEEWRYHIVRRNKIKQNIVSDYLMHLLSLKIEAQLPGVSTDVVDRRLIVYLTSEYNVSKDWNIFMDNNKGFLTAIGKSFEYHVSEDDSYGSFDYKWPDLTIWINYNNGKCERRLVGTKEVVVSENIYETICK